MLREMTCVGVTKNMLVEPNISQSRKPVGCTVGPKGAVSEDIVQANRNTETENDCGWRLLVHAKNEQTQRLRGKMCARV